MNKLTFTAAVFTIVLQSCAQQTEKKENKTKEDPKVTYHPAINHSFTINDFLGDNKQLDKDVDSIFKTLSDETKVAQLLMPAVGRLGETNELITQKIKENKIGGVLMLNGTKEEFTNWIKAYNELNPYKNNLPFLYSADAEPSLVNRKITGSTPVIKANEMKTIDEVRKYTNIISKDLNDIGINYNFSPVVDMSPNKTVGFRSFGAIPENIIPWSNAFIQETQKNGIIATAKHFPGHGLVSGDTHKALQMIDGELKEIKNYPKLIQDGVLSIMVAHIAVKNNEKYDTKGLPSTLSPEIVTNLLRNEYNFKGLIVTDAMNMGGVSSIPNAEIKAIEAGIDIILMPLNVDKAYNSLLKKYTEDKSFKSKVDIASKRIIRMKLCIKK
ncbi:MAG: glycoside hydrolase family 3 N-terminal domain-containing protein [Crocinitomicaceae bacterium]|jgi:beta-N-acetylhexosaminidase